MARFFDTPTCALLALLGGGLAASAPAHAQIESEELPPTASAAPSPAEAAVPSEREQVANQLYADGDLAGALRVFAELAAAHPQPATRARLGLTAAWLAWQLDDRARALELLEAALFAAPEIAVSPDLHSPAFMDAYRDALRVAVHRRRVAASEAINRAVEQIRAQDLSRARALLGEALELDPDDPDAVYNLAVVELREGHDSEALAGFDRVLALQRGNPEGVTRALRSQALNNAAVIYYSRGDYLDAATALGEAVRLDPDDGQAWFNLGLTREKLGEREGAREALRRARLLSPGDPDVARALALGEMELGNWVTAGGLLLEATRDRPADPDLRLLLGRAERGLGSSERAAAAFRLALEMDPQDRAGVGGTAALLLAETLHAQGDAAGSEAAARRAIELRPQEAGGFMFLGLSRLAANDVAGAVAELERARDLAPRRPDVLHNLGVALLAAGDSRRAQEAFRDALAIAPDHPGTRSALEQIVAREAAEAAAAPRRELGATLSAADYPELGLHGVRVDAVNSRSAAARAGLRAGDLVLEAEGRAVGSPADLQRALRARKGTTALTVLRSGQTLRLSFAWN